MHQTHTSEVEVRMHRALAVIARGVMRLGIGDCSTFSQDGCARCCNNLSAPRKTLSLHVCDGVLQRCGAYDRDPKDRWDSVLQRAGLELANN